ncbi:uncharacterized protein L969DRAFT_96482 [Mixia osmundae IAM 14324]|uniref:Trafficking protein particle complex subunit 11 domain-containing protein n=1 Tax=Mixia osmundae (strain CBS 9802 / IAM 14324 / JCM 22182 / KY 12970) TaxID=764103 RepID=G7DUW8_MIXOS|nr:uncharacterized protein L969DRAFT_96482 [Mixia osmundae IAM 14324]KEI37405.1 hypothetical protein L969DRAFT_96482 [Mixia osmundae IAM 14324]GAA94378.1 hypothetical protein E5Q_01029 [Mixia osmundae IAM 14324]
MEGFPLEFLAHHLPLLFVAGCDVAPSTAAALSSSESSHAAVDPFDRLRATLRKVLMAKSPAPQTIWDPSRGSGADFRIIFVDKSVGFPSRKARSAPGQSISNLAALHSPLSPLTASSPLHPDGLMAPIWLKKHRELVPAAFVLVLRLWEPSMMKRDHDQGDGRPGEQDEDEGELEVMTKVKDSEMILEISDRKKLCSERDVKLAVVLLTSRKMLDDPSLDPRLSHIRRQSGLESRGALFVITPVSVQEAQNFASSLRSELYDSAADYYKEHGRRARRKRSRVPIHSNPKPILSAVMPSSATNGIPKSSEAVKIQPLSAQAWSIRYDYKMATFAEFRQECDVALKHYEDCSDALLEIFSSTALMPPRTKRWAEAKVLADCINLKICKLYMYADEPERVVVQYTKHLARFRELCNGWGIGEETYEYWSWLAKQYRSLADLVELAVASGYRLPIPRLAASTRTPTPAQTPTGSSPARLLQHAGHFYLMAGLCTRNRRDKFRLRVVAETHQVNGFSNGHSSSLPPALQYEGKIKHDELTIDLLSKAYEIFKRQRSNRLSLYIAGQIARVHDESDNAEMALRFHERIAKHYRKDRWLDMMSNVAQSAKLNARDTNDAGAFAFATAEAAIRSCERPAAEWRLVDSLRALDSIQSGAEHDRSVLLDLTGLSALVEARIAFWQAEAYLDEEVLFQLSISSQTNFLDEVDFDSLEITFENSQTFRWNGQHQQGSRLALYDADTSEAILAWSRGSTLIFAGRIRSSKPVTVAFERLELAKTSSSYDIALELRNANVQSSLEWYRRDTVSQELQSFLLSSANDCTSCSFTRRPALARAVIEPPSALYIDDVSQVQLSISNIDSVALAYSVTIACISEPGRECVISDMHSDPAAVKITFDTDFLQPDQTITQTFWIRATGEASSRSLETMITPRISEESRTERTLDSIAEVTKLDFAAPFACTSTLQTLETLPLPELALAIDAPMQRTSLSIFSALTWLGASAISLEDVVLHSSSEQVTVLPETGNTSQPHQDLLPGTGYACAHEAEIDADFQPDFNLVVCWRRTDQPESVPANTSRFVVLHPQITAQSVAVAVDLPAVIRLHMPTSIRFTICNDSPTRLLKLTAQMDSSESWVFAGPRKIARFSVLPRRQRELRFALVAIGMPGHTTIPRLRVYEVVDPPPQPASEANAEPALPPPQPTLRELAVVVRPSWREPGASDSVESEARTSVYVMPG